MPLEKLSTEELLRELLSVQRDSQIIALGLAGVTQHSIREIVGVDIHRVSRIVKHLKRSREGTS